MKAFLFIFIITLGLMISCKTTSISHKKQTYNSKLSDSVRIANDSLEYEIIIIDNGFANWLISKAKSKNYYSQNYLENKNIQFVTAWNSRVNNLNYNQNLYEMTINYDPHINYGLDVNYKLYNYFIFFQNTYNQNLLGGFVPTN